MEVIERDFTEDLKQGSTHTEKVQKCIPDMRGVISQYKETRMYIVDLLTNFKLEVNYMQNMTN